jgi:hypothetical protein
MVMLACHYIYLPRLQIASGALGPVQHLLPGLQEHVLAVRQLPRQPIQDLVEGVTGLGGLREQHGLLHRWVSEQPLLPEDHFHRYGGQDGVQLGDIVLSHKDTNLLPWDGVRKGKDNVISDDHWDAAKDHRLHQTGAPWGPAQWAQAEDGSLHVLIVSWWVVCRDVEQRVVLEVLPD